MICFEVLVNGEVVCRAGGEAVWHIFAAVSLLVEKGEPHFVVHGMRKPEQKLDENVYWAPRTNLQVGDEVTVRIVENVTPTAFELAHSFGTRTSLGTIEHYCSFCGKKAGETSGMLVDRLANICFDCLRRHQPKPGDK